MINRPSYDEQAEAYQAITDKSEAEAVQRATTTLMEAGDTSAAGYLVHRGHLVEDDARVLAQALLDAGLLRTTIDITITRGIGKPATCVVKDHGVTIFDGISRDALPSTAEDSE